MPRHKQAQGGTAVLEPTKSPGLSTREALRFAYLVEDLLRAMKSRAPRDRRIAALLKTAEVLREDLEDRYDVEALREARKEPGSIPWEEVKKKAGL